ncbi:unnamed protein product [Rhizophagus irregularis]|nr:unnamed protein product [Rhizophagus irregularis]
MSHIELILRKNFIQAENHRRGMPLGREVERELDKESYYKRLNDYYGSNPTIGLPSAYDSIFKDIDSILKECLAPIPLSLERAQMKQALLYQGILITIDQVNEPDNNPSDIVEYMYDMLQIKLQDLLSNLDNTEIQEIWEPYSIWASFIRVGNVCTSTIKKITDKRIKFGSAMSMAKTSVQIAVTEGATGELTGLLTQFIMKYRCVTRLNIEEVQEDLSSKNSCQQQPLVVIDNNRIPEILNPEYYKPKGRPLKHYKAVTEMANK